MSLSGNTLYGTAGNGGNSGKGTVFKVNTDGTSFTTLGRATGNRERIAAKKVVFTAVNKGFAAVRQRFAAVNEGFAAVNKGMVLSRVPRCIQ